MARSRKSNSSLPSRRGPLSGVVVQGRFGAAHDGAPGVRLGVRQPVEIATIITRRGKARALSQALKKHFYVECPATGVSTHARGLDVHWCSDGQYYAVRQENTPGALYETLSDKLKGLASISDQSHGRVVITISGPDARKVLAKGAPVDLHPRGFGPGKCAVTQMAHVGVHIAQTGEDEFELSLFRGFAESFWEWLTEMSAEFGYEVL